MRSLAWGTKDKVYCCINEKRDVWVSSNQFTKASLKHNPLKDWGLAGFPFLLLAELSLATRGLLCRLPYHRFLMLNYEIRIHFKSRTIFSSTPKVFVERVSRNEKDHFKSWSIPLVEDRWGQRIESRIKKKKKRRGEQLNNTTLQLASLTRSDWRLLIFLVEARRVNSRKGIQVYK